MYILLLFFVFTFLHASQHNRSMSFVPTEHIYTDEFGNHVLSYKTGPISRKTCRRENSKELEFVEKLFQEHVESSQDLVQEKSQFSSNQSLARQNITTIAGESLGNGTLGSILLLTKSKHENYKDFWGASIWRYRGSDIETQDHEWCKK